MTNQGGVKLQSKCTGFTIVELLVVIVVIGILAAITIIAYTGISQRAIISSLQSDLTNAANQLKLDQVIGSSYPANLSLANGGKGIQSSAGTSYQYTVNNSNNPPIFCLTATNGIYSYNITQDHQPLAGVCPVLNLDAGDSTSYSGTGTNLVDLSGNGNNGTLVNGVSYSSTNGGVLSLDGVDDYVDTTYTLPDEGSISVWYYARPWYDYQTIYDNSANTDDWEMWIYSTGVLMARIESDLTTSYNLGSLAGPNNWYYITVTWKKSPIELSLYVNGIKRSTDTAGTWVNPGTHFYLGGGNPGNAKGNGLVSNVALHNRALSADEVQQNFNASRGRFGI